MAAVYEYSDNKAERERQKVQNPTLLVSDAEACDTVYYDAEMYDSVQLNDFTTELSTQNTVGVVNNSGKTRRIVKSTIVKHSSSKVSVTSHETYKNLSTCLETHEQEPLPKGGFTVFVVTNLLTIKIIAKTDKDGRGGQSFRTYEKPLEFYANKAYVKVTVDNNGEIDAVPDEAKSMRIQDGLVIIDRDERAAAQDLIIDIMRNGKSLLPKEFQEMPSGVRTKYMEVLDQVRLTLPEGPVGSGNIEDSIVVKPGKIVRVAKQRLCDTFGAKFIVQDAKALDFIDGPGNK